MILPWLILVPVLGAGLAWLGGRVGGHPPRWIALAALTTDFGLTLWAAHPAPATTGAWLASFDRPWVSPLGIRLHLAMDGLSLLLILLTLGLGILSVIASWSEITERVGAFHVHLLLTLAGIVGVFLALDLLLFFFFWELMLIPMSVLIAVWGHERRTYAAIKFFLFTQASGLLMFVAIVTLASIHYRQTGSLSFDYGALAQTRPSPQTAFWLMLGFFIAFAVKLPAFPFHPWLPDAHTEAPTAGSVILAGLLLKTGAYGLLRFVLPLFPVQSRAFAPAAMALGVVGILYGAILAFAQRDVKRLVAYTSVSHLGFVLLGIYSMNAVALQGAVMQMLAHGLSTGGLFILVGALQERLHTRDMDAMGGLWSQVPRLSAIGLFFAIASLGLPGLGDFVGEFLVLLGAWRASPGFAIAAALGLVLSVVYALALVQRVFHGERRGTADIPDFSPRHMAIMAVMMAVLVWFGISPQPVFDTAAPGLAGIQRTAAPGGS